MLRYVSIEIYVVKYVSTTASGGTTTQLSHGYEIESYGSLSSPNCLRKLSKAASVWESR